MNYDASPAPNRPECRHPNRLYTGVRRRRVFLMMRDLFGIVCLLGMCGCVTNEQLGVNLGKPTYWRNQKGERFVARYGSLSDGSLNFVKVTMPNGQKVTLPQVVSASGARYTDEMEFVWWEHQGTVYVDVKRDDGKWDENHWELQSYPQAR